MTHDDYPEDYLRAVLRDTSTIAMVGANPNWNRPSYFVMKYLQSHGFRVIPINPVAVGQEILGERVVGDLADLAEPVDMVDVFRNSEAAGPIADQSIQLGAKILWMQIGVRNDAAAARAEAAGLRVVMNRCPKIEHARLSGQLGWGGMNTGIISAKRRRS